MSAAAGRSPGEQTQRVEWRLEFRDAGEPDEKGKFWIRSVYEKAMI